MPHVSQGGLPPLPQGYYSKPWDYTGPMFTVSQMRAYARASLGAAQPAKAEPQPVAVVRSVEGGEVRVKWLAGFPQIGDRLYCGGTITAQAGEAS